MVRSPSPHTSPPFPSHFGRYSQEWEKTVKRIGRWIDFKNDYKTLDITFMESVWWVFKQLFEKGLVYRGFKVRDEEVWGTCGVVCDGFCCKAPV